MRQPCPHPTPLGANTAPDPDEPNTNGGYYDEGEDLLASDCTLYDPTTSSKRDTEELLDIDFVVNTTGTLEERSWLVKRGVRDVKNALNLCYQGAKVGTLSPQTYPGSPSLIRSGRLVFAAAKPLGCGVLALSQFAKKPDGVDIVAEHVLEKQQLRDIWERLLSASLRGGGTLKQGALQYTGILDNNGLIRTGNWPDLSALPERYRAYGPNIMDTFFGILGRTADKGSSASINIDNLQVLERGINGVKALMVSGKDFTKGWSNLGPLQQIAELGDAYGVYDYLNSGVVQTSYQTTYKAIYTLMGVLKTVVSSQAGVNYDFQSATQQIIAADLATMPLESQALMKTLLGSALEYWSPDTAMFNHGALITKTAIETIKLYQDQIKTRLILDASKMMGP